VTTASVSYGLLRDVAACLDGTADPPVLERAREGVERLLLAECEHEWREVRYFMRPHRCYCERCGAVAPPVPRGAT
jgi:hypothetical protein